MCGDNCIKLRRHFRSDSKWESCEIYQVRQYSTWRLALPKNKNKLVLTLIRSAYNSGLVKRYSMNPNITSGRTLSYIQLVYKVHEPPKLWTKNTAMYLRAISGANTKNVKQSAATTQWIAKICKYNTSLLVD